MLPTRRNNQVWFPDFFNDFFDNNWLDRPSYTTPAINVLEKDNAYELQVAAPGMNKNDFHISLDNEGDLVIKMEKKCENNGKENEHKNGHWLRREFSYEKSQQTLVLPEDADREKICAKMENGVLTVSVPKLAPKAQENSTKVIDIQ